MVMVACGLGVRVCSNKLDWRHGEALLGPLGLQSSLFGSNGDPWVIHLWTYFPHIFQP